MCEINSRHQPLPEHLPREEQVRVTASFKVTCHVCPKRRCKDCETIVQAPGPMRPIARGMAGPGLLV